MAETQKNLLDRGNFFNGVGSNESWKKANNSGNAPIGGYPDDDGVPLPGGLIVGRGDSNTVKTWLKGSYSVNNPLTVWIKAYGGGQYNSWTNPTTPIRIGIYRSQSPSGTPPTSFDSDHMVELVLEPGVEHKVNLLFEYGQGFGSAYLYLQTTGAESGRYAIESIRLDKTENDITDIGIFDGDTPDTDSATFSWDGTPNLSHSTAVIEEVVPDIEVEPAAPEFTDDNDNGGGSWSTPTVEGVTYDPASGLANPEETITVTATAQAGYVLTGQTSWSHTFPAAPIPDPEDIEVAAPAPTFVDFTETGGGSWSTETVEGVTYSPASGTVGPGMQVTVSATALPGYVILGQRVWSHTFPDVPSPDPAPEAPEIAANVARLLGIEQSDPELYGVVTSATELVSMMAYGYTRGNGFTVVGTELIPVKPDLVAVITAAATRLAANPSGLRYRAGTETVSDAFSGWTLVEKYVLDRYRKRWA